MVQIELTEKPLDIAKCRQFVTHDKVGGIVVFAGTVRNITEDKKVLRLEFEAYRTMATSEMKKIGTAALRKWDIHAIAIHHRTGILQIGEMPVVIAVGAAHRQAAFEACQYAIDTLKETVPIWKKEVFANGEVWVAAHP